MKRCLDIFVVLVAAPLWLPVSAVVAIVVWLDLGSPVIFSQKRAGQFGRTFRVFKFRTMSDKRGADGELLADEHRVSRVGAFLRSSSLDEVPQLLNILLGNLSLVGPRPLHTRYVSRYSEFQSQRLLAVPGITGWAQINGRNALSWDEKFELDVWYVKNRNWRVDLMILWRTIMVVFKRSGVNTSQTTTMEEFQGSTDDHVK